MRYGADVAPVGEKLIMKAGDVLFGKRRAYQKKVASAPFDGIFSAHGMVLRPRENVVDSNFFPLFIGSDYFLDAAISISVGSLSPTINWRDLRELEFDLPPLEEQRKLAKVLWAINDTIEAYKNLIAATDDLVKARFVEMFGSVKIREELSSLCVNGPQNGFYRKDDLHEFNMPIVKMKELFANECIANATSFDMVNMTPEEQKRFMLTPDDLLFGRRSLVIEGAGKCKRVGDIAYPLAFESSVLRITLDTKKVLPRFVQEWFDADEGQRSIKAIRATTTISGIKGSDLKKILIPVPDIEAQKVFLNFAIQADKSKSALQRAMTAAQATYKNIIAKNI